MFTAALMVALCLIYGHNMVTGTERVAMLGNNIEASASGVDVAGTTGLMSDFVLNEGVVFAYSAFFRSEKPVRFQIWRPVENVSDSYQLIGETRVIPAVKNAREDIYIESKLSEKCVRVQSGDRLGVYIEEAPGAVAYTFKPESPQALLHTAKNVSEVSKMNDIIKFGSLNFPYVFSVLAYLDTNMDLYNNSTEEFPECPKGLRIPPYGVVTLPPTPPPTGKPGATGATGPAGIQGATGANGTQGEKGGVGSTGEQGLPGATGTRGFNGTVGATGLQGPIGLDGVTGEKGDTGDIGATGPRGPVGLQGPAGETITVPAPIAAQAVDDDANMFSDPNFVMGLFIWLIILTILFIIILIVFLVVRRRRRGVERPKPGNKIVYSERVQSRIYENDEKWMRDMKEETETNYSNNTLKADGTENDAQRPTSFDYTNECDKQFDYVNGEQVKAGMTQC